MLMIAFILASLQLSTVSSFLRKSKSIGSCLMWPGATFCLFLYPWFENSLFICTTGDYYPVLTVRKVHPYHEAGVIGFYMAQVTPHNQR